MTSQLCCFLDGRASAQHNQISHGDLLASGLGSIEGALDALQRGQRGRKLGRFIYRPVLLRRQPDSRTIGAAALVRIAESGR